MRSRVTVSALLLACAIAGTSTAAAQPAGEYLRLIERYPQDPEGTAAILDSWPRRDAIEEGVAACLQIVPEQQRARCSDRQIIAAAMLHTDIALKHIGHPFVFRDEHHVRMAMRLLSAVISSQAAFAVQWFEFVATLYVAAGRAADASVVIAEGLSRYARAARLFVVRGVITEQRVFQYNNLRGEELQNDGASGRVFRTLQDAAADYRRALAIDPTLGAARVRLGAIAVLLRDDGAAAILSPALDAREEARSRYLAHLFLGSIAAREQRWDDATREYRAAREVAPAYQTACVALSHAEDARGNRDEARRTAMVCAHLRDDEADPWWGHRLGNADPRLLEALHAEARRR